VNFRHEVTADLEGERLDTALAALESALSRAQVRRLIVGGHVRVSDEQVKPAHRLRRGERIEGHVPEPVEAELAPEPIPLEIVFEDDDLIVVDKPSGLVVHPAAGVHGGTLVNALLHHCENLSGIGGVRRPGIVHRLDKGTSGLLVAAKNDLAHNALARQFKEHTIEREYLALVRGEPGAQRGSVDAAIGRHPSDRKRFSTRARRGRMAVTHWAVERRLRDLTLLRLRLETGRTHQIRVHLASIGLPVLGDPVYGGGKQIARELGLRRQALHAVQLGFDHPRTGERLRFSSRIPEDLAGVIESQES
jgi:23S rRNA pseudouridine1911/1915/1917 synthase